MSALPKRPRIRPTISFFCKIPPKHIPETRAVRIGLSVVEEIQTKPLESTPSLPILSNLDISLSPAEIIESISKSIDPSDNLPTCFQTSPYRGEIKLLIGCGNNEKPNPDNYLSIPIIPCSLCNG